MKRALGFQICIRKTPRTCLCNNCHTYVCFYRGTSHSGVHERLTPDPSIISPRGLPDGRSRPCSPHVGTFSCLQVPTFSAHSERSTWLATLHVDQPAVFITMIRPLSNSLSCEKCLQTRLPDILRFLKSSNNRHVVVTFINLPLNAGLYCVLFLIAAPLQVYSHVHCHQTWIICISHILHLICKVSLLYFLFPSWGAIFNVLECI